MRGFPFNSSFPCSGSCIWRAILKGGPPHPPYSFLMEAASISSSQRYFPIPALYDSCCFAACTLPRFLRLFRLGLMLFVLGFSRCVGTTAEVNSRGRYLPFSSGSSFGEAPRFSILIPFPHVQGKSSSYTPALEFFLTPLFLPSTEYFVVLPRFVCQPVPYA